MINTNYHSFSELSRQHNQVSILMIIVYFQITLYVLVLQPVINGKLKARTWLSTKEQEKNILLRFEIPNTENQWGELSYLPGDHLAIFPENSDEDVQFVMNHLAKKPKEDEEVQLYEYNAIDGKKNNRLFKHLTKIN